MACFNLLFCLCATALLFGRNESTQQHCDEHRLHHLIWVANQRRQILSKILPEKLKSFQDQLIFQMLGCLHNTEVMNGLNGTLYNRFLNGLVLLSAPTKDAINVEQMDLIDQFYQLMLTHDVMPVIVTFNTLLKAVRYTQPPLHKFAALYLDEMEKYGITWDSFTILEFLAMCAKAPFDASADRSRTNVGVAKYYFDWYRKHLWPLGGRARKSATHVVRAYYDVLSRAGDMIEMEKLLSWKNATNVSKKINDLRSLILIRTDKSDNFNTDQSNSHASKKNTTQHQTHSKPPQQSQNDNQHGTPHQLQQLTNEVERSASPPHNTQLQPSYHGIETTSTSTPSFSSPTHFKEWWKQNTLNECKELQDCLTLIENGGWDTLDVICHALEPHHLIKLGINPEHVNRIMQMVKQERATQSKYQTFNELS
eukprot:394873_1